MRRPRYRRAAPGERFLLMPEWILVHDRWRALSADARAILIHVCIRWSGPSIAKLGRINNNSHIGYGCRTAGRIGIKKDTAAHALTELIEAGFLRPNLDTGLPGFAADGKRQAREFRITFFPTHGHAATWRNSTSNVRRILIEHRLLKSAAYGSLSSAAKVVLIELMRRENGSNNGRIKFGAADGAHIQLTLDVTKRAVLQVKSRGFTVMTAAANKRRGTTRKWRLTMYKADGKAATMDFLNRPHKSVMPVSLVHLKPADGLAGAPKPVSADSAADATEAAVEHQSRQDLQSLVTDSAVQNDTGEQGEVYVHEADTYRIPGVRTPPARSAPVARSVKTRTASADTVLVGTRAPEPPATPNATPSRSTRRSPR